MPKDEQTYVQPSSSKLSSLLKPRMNSHYVHVLILIRFNTIRLRLCDTWTVLFMPSDRCTLKATTAAMSHWIFIHTSKRIKTFSTREFFMNKWLNWEIFSAEFKECWHHSRTICVNFKTLSWLSLFCFGFYWMFWCLSYFSLQISIEWRFRCLFG